MKRILFSLVALVAIGFAASPAMAHGYRVRSYCVPVCPTPIVSNCVPTVTTCSPAPVITQPCAPAVTTCVPAPTCAPVTYYHSYRVSHWGHSRRCR
jgi:hypothetical protein